MQVYLPWGVMVLAILVFIQIILLLSAKIKQNRQNENIEQLLNVSYEAVQHNGILRNEVANLKQDIYYTKQEQNAQLRVQQESLDANISKSLQYMQAQFDIMDRKQTAFQESIQTRMDTIRQENTRNIESIRQSVDEKLNDTLNKRFRESFAMISERLESVNKSIGEMQSLSVGVQSLQKTLSNVKTRGIWGELQLQMLLEQVLTQSQYLSNVKIGKGEDRVEFALIIPSAEEQILLPIDSKFPQASFTRLQSAYESMQDAEIATAQKEFVQAIKTEAKRISKYIQPPQTTDFAVLFLPIESLFAECVRQTDLIEELQNKYRITVAGPTTMLALL
ncbi:MAG: DNA recombination protein RmuC, partial [Eubacteriales bacterium]|nr:DNA recombination protein RmuC [Eubacteriales bacterium]